MTTEITFPYSVKLEYTIYDFEGVYKVKGDRLHKVVLKNGKSLSLGKTNRQLEHGVKLELSEGEECNHYFKNLITVTITSKNNLPVEIWWFSQSSYTYLKRFEEMDGRKYITRVFFDEDSGEVKVKREDGWR